MIYEHPSRKIKKGEAKGLDDVSLARKAFPSLFGCAGRKTEGKGVLYFTIQTKCVTNLGFYVVHKESPRFEGILGDRHFFSNLF